MRLIWPQCLLLLPYLPLGILLLLLRIFTYPHVFFASFVFASCHTIKRLVLRVMCFVLGLAVWVKDRKEFRDSQKHLPIVSNHVTLFDHLVICLSRDCVTPHKHVFHWYSSFSEVTSQMASDGIIQNVQEHVSPIQLFPELTPSYSTDCLLKFDSDLLESLDRVQPVALHVYRPFPIKLVEYPIIWCNELIWHLFVPFTWYYVEYLEPMNRQTDESTPAFSDRIRKAISLALSVRLSDITAVELNQSFNAVDNNNPLVVDSPDHSSLSASLQSSTSTQRSSSTSFQTAEDSGVRYRGPAGDLKAVLSSQSRNDSSSAAFDHLIPVVREIMGDVSEQRIRRALINSKGDVDAAVESLFLYQEDVSILQVKAGLVPVSRLSMAADFFHSNPKHRQASLRDRRNALMGHARERFLSVQSKES